MGEEATGFIPGSEALHGSAGVAVGARVEPISPFIEIINKGQVNADKSFTLYMQLNGILSKLRGDLNTDQPEEKLQEPATSFVSQASYCQDVTARNLRSIEGCLLELEKLVG